MASTAKLQPETQDPDEGSGAALAPYPGSKKMPRWDVAELVDAPKFTWKNWFALLGPGLLMGGSAIGGGEWLMGPTVTARYGGALMWLATISILGQVVYNIEICRYTLYTGEPIFTGKFRTLPGPMFWLVAYLILDFGAVFPYLAANAATPAAALWLGEIPDSSNVEHQALLRGLAFAIFWLSFVPLIFGGKIYNLLKALMTVKIFIVLGFLTVLGVFYTNSATWKEIFSGFLKVGTVPVRQAEDANGNGILDNDERDWDGDGHADVVEKAYSFVDTNRDGTADAFDFNADGKADAFVELDEVREGERLLWPDSNGDGNPDPKIQIVGEGSNTANLELGFETEPQSTGEGTQRPVRFVGLDKTGDRKIDTAFVDFDRDGTQDGDSTVNLFHSLATGKGLPDIDLSMIAFLAAFVAIAGSGGLSNTPVSNYTRDQGWGMGHHVGAIPSVIGGQNIQLSHVGAVFEVNETSLPRWKRWYKHVCRDQLAVWMPACFLGVALPSILSVMFLKRGTVADQWTAAGMTAGGVQEAVTAKSGAMLGNAFWFMTLFCGFLVLAPSMATSIDGFIRRWVDVFWTGSKRLRALDPKNIRYVYFAVLCVFCAFGTYMLSIGQPLQLIKISTNIFNLALGFSCLHALALNHVLLPKPLRPGWFMSVSLFFTGVFFLGLAAVSGLKNFGWI
jgi:hypothetical protein